MAKAGEEGIEVDRGTMVAVGKTPRSAVLLVAVLVGLANRL